MARCCCCRLCHIRLWGKPILEKGNVKLNFQVCQKCKIAQDKYFSFYWGLVQDKIAVPLLRICLAERFKLYEIINTDSPEIQTLMYWWDLMGLKCKLCKLEDQTSSSPLKLAETFFRGQILLISPLTTLDEPSTNLRMDCNELGCSFKHC